MILPAIAEIRMPEQRLLKYDIESVTTSAGGATFSVTVDNDARLIQLRMHIAASSNTVIEIGMFTRTYNGNPGGSNMCKLYQVDTNKDCEFKPGYGARNLSNTVKVLPFTTGMELSTGVSGTSDIGFRLDITNIAGNSFKFKITVVQNTSCTFLRVHFLVYEKVAAESESARTFTGSILQTSSAATTTVNELNVMAVNVSNFLLGLCAFVIPNGNEVRTTQSWQMIDTTHLRITLNDLDSGRVLYYHWFVRIKLRCGVSPDTDVILSLDRTACVSGCPIMQYNSGQNRCLQCYYSCYTCVNASNYCTQCNLTRDHRVMDTSNHCNCIIKWYDSPTTPECQPCHYSCLTCSEAGKSQCLSCNSTAPRTLDQAECPCNQGYYDNGLTEGCNQCHYSCYYCTDRLSTDCSRCFVTWFRSVMRSSSCPCDIGYYDGGLSRCLACHYTCLTCSGPLSAQCISCAWTEGRVLLSGECICGYNFFENAAGACQACHYSCLNCSGPSNTQCLACYENSHRVLEAATCPCEVLFYDNAVLDCVACHYSCMSCSAPLSTNCVACAESWFRTFSTGTRECLCAATFYDGGQSVCLPCHYTCYTCSGTPACLSCDLVDAHRQLSVTVCACVANYYEAGVKVCGACHVTCKTCVGAGPNNCTTCEGSEYRTLVLSACPCMTHFYNSN